MENSQNPGNRMKVVYLAASSDISGGQRVLFQQSEALAGRGHTVTIVCPDPPPTWFPLQRTRWEMSSVARSNALPEADICVATYWTTVRPATIHFSGPIFHLCQGYEADFSFNAPLLRDIEAAYAQHTHKLTVSPHVAQRLEAVGHSPVTYVGQTFDPAAFPPPEQRPFDRHPPTILLIGIFEAEVKGIREGLSALAGLRASGTPFHLHRISTWPLCQEEQAVFAADTYRFRLSPSQMAQAYGSADLLIGPSHPEEGFGLPVLEALSSGLPLLLSDTPGHRHIAGTAAHYFPCGDISGLRFSAKRLLENGQLRAELSAKGPGQAARFRTETVADRLIDVFTKALTP
jgi:glycosyltransferase involved in cell wall biosynthesis